MTRTLEDRIIELESTVAMQDRTLEKLNEALLEQQRLIDRLEAGMSALAEQLRIVTEPAGEGQPDEPLPPHYQTPRG